MNALDIVGYLLCIIKVKFVLCSLLYISLFSITLQFPLKPYKVMGGGEYTSNVFQSFLVDKWITHQISCPHTLEQNGLAERKHRHIVETSFTLLQNASLPASFWSFACQTAIYLINRMPSLTTNNQSPFEVLFQSVLDVQHLRIFGCACFPLLKPYTSNKLQPKTKVCIFLGYASKYKGYICFEVSSKKCYISRHVIFDECDFLYPSLLQKSYVSSQRYISEILMNPVSVTSKNTIVGVPLNPTVSSPSVTPSAANANDGSHNSSHAAALSQSTTTSDTRSPITGTSP